MWDEIQFWEVTIGSGEEEFWKGMPASREELPWKEMENSFILQSETGLGKSCLVYCDLFEPQVHSLESPGDLCMYGPSVHLSGGKAGTEAKWSQDVVKP